MRDYLDNDGVLLNKVGQLAEGAEDFLRWVAVAAAIAFYLSNNALQSIGNGKLAELY